MIKIKGKKQVLKNLNRAIIKIEGNTEKGMLAAGLFVENESNEIVPQDLGALINSSFTSVGRVAKRIVARIGYTINYAAFVHEMPESNNFSKPGTGPKFLFKAVTKNASKILKIIQSRAKF
jgi:hypothetical protein